MTTYTLHTPAVAGALNNFLSTCILIGKGKDGYEFMCNPNEDIKVQE